MYLCYNKETMEITIFDSVIHKVHLKLSGSHFIENQQN